MRRSGLEVMYNQCFSEKDHKEFSHLLEMEKHLSDTLSISDDIKLEKRKHKLSDKIISRILKHKKTTKSIMSYLLKHNEENYHKVFYNNIYNPWMKSGNKYHKRFDEFYEFLSQFGCGSLLDNYPSNEITLFRVMDEDEYEKIQQGYGVISPSFTLDPTYLNNFSSILPLVNKKGVYVMMKFHTDDIIFYDESNEKEVLVKKGSQPTFIKKIYEYDIDDLVDDYGEGVKDYLPLTSEELLNGFNHLDSLYLKGFEDLKKTHTKSGNLWISPNLNKNSWYGRYQRKLLEIITKYGNKNEPHIKGHLSMVEQIVNMGDKIGNNPYSDVDMNQVLEVV